MSKQRPSSKRFWTKEELASSPSVRAGLNPAAEAKFRFNFCQLIRDCAKQLKLPFFVEETAIVFTHRYFAVRSHFKNDKFVVATACLFLATKVDNSPRSVKDVVNTCLSWRCLASKRHDIRSLLHSQEYFETLRESVLNAESAVLVALGFDMFVDHPWNTICRIMKQLLGEHVANSAEGRKLLQSAQNMCNDSMSTTLALQFPAEHIGAAAVYVMAKLRKEPLPWGPTDKFAERFGIPQDTLDEIEAQIMELYDRVTDVKPPASAPSASDPAPPPLLPPPPRMVPHAPSATTGPSRVQGGADAGVASQGGAAATRLEGTTKVVVGTVRGCGAVAAVDSQRFASVDVEGPGGDGSSPPCIYEGDAQVCGGKLGLAKMVVVDVCSDGANVSVCGGACDSGNGAPLAALTPDGGGDVRRLPSPVTDPSPARKRSFESSGLYVRGAGVGGSGAQRARVQVV